jgi:hypothetical protein
VRDTESDRQEGTKGNEIVIEDQNNNEDYGYENGPPATQLDET